MTETLVAYIGNPSSGISRTWKDVGTAVTKLGTKKGDPFTNNGPTTGQILTLDPDQSPDSISFAGAHLVSSASGTARFMLCNPDGEDSFAIARITFDGAGSYHVSVLDNYDLFPNTLEGQTLCLKKSGSADIYLDGQASINLVVTYLSRDITRIQKTGGTISTNSGGSAIRGQEVEIYVTPDDPYWKCTRIDASAGTVTKISDTLWKLVMPTPAVNVTLTPSYTRIHALIPSADADITFSQNEYELTVTKHGTCEDTWGYHPYYRLLRDGELVKDNIGDVTVITLTDEDMEKPYTYTVEAYYPGELVVQFASKTYTALSVHKTLGYYESGRFRPAVGYVWTGTEWQEVWPYTWDGTQWVLCSQT